LLYNIVYKRHCSALLDTILQTTNTIHEFALHDGQSMRKKS
jgi:hypothetical protein